jgi:hypothetical protein
MSIKTGVKVWRKIAIGSGYRRPRGELLPETPLGELSVEAVRRCADEQSGMSGRLSAVLSVCRLTKAEPAM